MNIIKRSITIEYESIDCKRAKVTKVIHDKDAFVSEGWAVLKKMSEKIGDDVASLCDKLPDDHLDQVITKLKLRDLYKDFDPYQVRKNLPTNDE